MAGWALCQAAPGPRAPPLTSRPRSRPAEAARCTAEPPSRGRRGSRRSRWGKPRRGAASSGRPAPGPGAAPRSGGSRKWPRRSAPPARPWLRRPGARGRGAPGRGARRGRMPTNTRAGGQAGRWEEAAPARCRRWGFAAGPSASSCRLWAHPSPPCLHPRGEEEAAALLPPACLRGGGGGGERLEREERPVGQTDPPSQVLAGHWQAGLTFGSQGGSQRSLLPASSFLHRPS